MARARIWLVTVIAGTAGLGVLVPVAATAAPSATVPARACADAVCASTDQPSVCWHGGRDEGAVCFSAIPY